MNNNAEVGWTDEQWNRVHAVVTEEAQRARVAAQFLPVVGPIDSSVVAVPDLALTFPPNPVPPPPGRMHINSNPNLNLARISVLVDARNHEVSDPDLSAVTGMFRRAANFIARIEDAIVWHGQVAAGAPPALGVGAIPPVYRVTGGGAQPAIFPGPGQPLVGRVNIGGPFANGVKLVNGIVRAVNALEARGQFGPYACMLDNRLFQILCTPTASMVLPRDRVLPLLRGPVLRNSAALPSTGAVIALNGSPVELVMASDIHVRYLQTTLEPRIVFRVSERFVLRIKETQAIAILR